MLIPHKDHSDTIQVYSVTVMTHVKALQAGQSSQGTAEPITPALLGWGAKSPMDPAPLVGWLWPPPSGLPPHIPVCPRYRSAKLSRDPDY